MRLLSNRSLIVPFLFSQISLHATPSLGEQADAGSQSAEQQSAIRLSDGSPVRVAEDAVSISPPVGWEILPNHMGKSLVLQSPKQISDDAADVNKDGKLEQLSEVIFQPNITIAVRHEAVPIDQYQAESLQRSLKEAFGAKNDSFVTSPDYKFFDFKGKKDGLISYSFLELNGFPMTQMHVLVSGSNKSVLLTYTDLSEGFEQRMEAIWPNISSIQVEGLAPSRLDAYRSWAIAGGAGLIFILGGLWLRRRRYKNFLADLSEFDTDDNDGFSDDLSGDFFDHARPPLPNRSNGMRFQNPSRKQKRVNQRHHDAEFDDAFDDFDSGF